MAEQEVVVTPGAGPATVPVTVANTSTIVEAYDVTLVDPPPWLQVVPGEARLLPGTDEDLQLTLSIHADDLVPVQRVPLQLRVQARSTEELRTHSDLDVVVGAVQGPVTLELEPTTVRARDATMAMFRVVVDNRRSNEPLTVDLDGEDAEHAARFGFSPARLEVPPAGRAESRLRVDAPLPEPGEHLTRTLTVSASDGSTTLEVFGTFMQSASSTVVDPPVGLRLNPNTVRAGRAGRTVILVDNRRGTQPQHITLSAHDDEGAVRFRISPVDLEVPAGRTSSARLEMQAPRPDGGEEVTRPITVTAWNGRETVEAEGSLLQHAPDRRPLFRALATLAGAVLMILGAFMHWTTLPALLRGIGWGVTEVIIRFNLVNEIDRDILLFLDRPGVRQLVDAVLNPGVILILLALLAVLGLVGATGRLTRLAAAAAALFVVLSFVALIVGGAVRQIPVSISGGALAVLLLGCLVTFVGGMLARR